MSHIRTQIRDAMIQILTPAAQAAGAEIYRQRVKPLRDTIAPWINVETDGETVESIDDLYSQERALTINVRIIAKDSDEVADVLDSVAVYLEQAIAEDPTLGGLVRSLNYKGANPDYKSAAEVELAELVLEYSCIYVWTPAEAGAPFLHVNAQFDMASPRNDPQTPTGPDGQTDASARVDLPQ